MSRAVCVSLRIKATFSFAMLCLSLAGGVCLALTGALTPDWRRSRGMRKLLGHAGAAGVRVVQLATPQDAMAVSTSSPPDAIVATPARLRQLAIGDNEAGGGGGGGGGGGDGGLLQTARHMTIVG